MQQLFDFVYQKIVAGVVIQEEDIKPWARRIVIAELNELAAQRDIERRLNMEIFNTALGNVEEILEEQPIGQEI
jgi:hypothetical protein